jgi:hypothetical protein
MYRRPQSHESGSAGHLFLVGGDQISRLIDLRQAEACQERTAPGPLPGEVRTMGVLRLVNVGLPAELLDGALCAHTGDEESPHTKTGAAALFLCSHCVEQPGNRVYEPCIDDRYGVWGAGGVQAG